MVLLWLYFGAETYICKSNNTNWESSTYCKDIELFKFDEEKQTQIEQFLLGVLSIVLTIAFVLVFSWVYIY